MGLTDTTGCSVDVTIQIFMDFDLLLVAKRPVLNNNMEDY